MRDAVGRARSGSIRVALIVAAITTLAATASFAAPGDVDRSLGKRGFALVEPAGVAVEAGELAVGADGKLYLAGTARVTGPVAHSVVAVAVATPTGGPSAGFAGDGRLEFTFGPLGEAVERGVGITVGADGRVVVAGTGSGDGFDLARFNVDGSPDLTFGGDGRVTESLPNAPSAEAASVLVLPDGRIVVGGSTGTASRDFVVARYMPDGSLDQSFSGNGARTLDVGANDDLGEIALAGDGSIVVVGTSANAEGSRLVLARLLADGTPDPAFSEDGSLVTSIRVSGLIATGGDVEVAIDTLGRIVAAGTLAGDKRAFAARFTPAGAPDASFSSDGLARINFPGFAATAEGIAALPGGGIAVAADATRRVAGWTSADLGAAWLRDDGQPDQGFANRGKAIVDLHCDDEAIGAAALEPDGELVLAGVCGLQDPRSGQPDSASFALLRFESAPGPADLDADGVLDKRDRCPEAYGPRKGRGCARIARDVVALRFARGTIAGRLDAGDDDCEYRQEVELFRQRKGGNRRVAHQDTQGDRFAFAVERRSGTYVVQVKRRREPRAGFCAAADAILKP